MSTGSKSLYFALMSLAAIAGLLKFFVFSKLLSVEDFGAYSLVMSVAIIGVFVFGFGGSEGLLKLGSRVYTHENKETLTAYYLSTSIGVLALGGLFFLLMFSMIIVLEVDNSNLYVFGALIIIAWVQFNLVDAYIRSMQQFTVYSSALFLKSLLVLATGGMYGYTKGADGLLISEAIGAFVPVLLFILYLLSQKLPAINMSHLGVIIKSGYKMMGAVLVRNIALMVDKLFVGASLGALALGYYSFSMILVSIAMIAVGFIVSYCGPIWLSRFKEVESTKSLFWSIVKVLIPIQALCILGGGGCNLILPDFLAAVYPAYENDTVIAIVGIVTVGIFFILPIYLFDWFFIATSNEGCAFISSMIALLVASILYSVVFFYLPSLINYAVVFLIVRVIWLALYLYFIYIIGFRDVYSN